MKKDIKLYIDNLPPKRAEAIIKLRQIIIQNIPEGFEETMNYNLPSFVVPHSIYPSGYHCDNKLPLPFISIASQKHFISLYHMGIYSDISLLEWFKTEYAKVVDTKLDMGKSCIRFKNINKIPFDLVGKLATKMTAKKWISIYEKERQKQSQS